MATNPYEQFVTPAENPYAQFVSPTQTSSTGIPTGRSSYGLSEVPLAAGKNLPESAGKFVSGVVEAVTSPVQTLSSILDIGAGALRNVLPKPVVSFIDKFDKDPTNAERASQAADAAGGVLKDRYGSYESIKRTFAEDPVGAVADLSTLLTAGGAAATKLGALNVGSAASKAGAAINPMRAVAPIIEVPIKMAASGVGAVYNALAPKSTAYLGAVEGRGPEIVNALRNANEIVPGSMPTAAQAASSVGATKFSNLGAEAANQLSTPFFARSEAQKAAQLAQVQSIGGTPEMLSAAEKVRSATAKNLYGIADQALVKADSTFTNLLERPSMNKVLARAKDLADEKS